MIIWIFVLILSSVVSEVLLEQDCTIYDAIKGCKMEDDIFGQFEREICSEKSFKPSPNHFEQQDGIEEPKPSVTGPSQRFRILQKYHKELNQWPFECIYNSLNKTSISELEKKEMYKKLVRRCRSQQAVLHCDPSSPYRTFNGTCNNLRNPTWGSSLSCLQRLMYPHYEGAAGFRQSVCGGPLPKPRELSIEYHTPKNRSSHEFSNMLPFFGQLIAHDVTGVPKTSVEGKTINCCEKNVSKEDLHSQCAPIHISHDDPFYSSRNVTCLNFIRSAPCLTCSPNKRYQMNEVTSFIDASFLYGLDDKINNGLRTRKNGTLVSQYKEAGELLPANHRLNSTCGSVQSGQYCFRSGDHRINQQVPLMSQQTVWHREHNRIATILQKLNPNWSDEILFQETRKIVIAMLQSITYKEFLPLVVGQRLMTHYDLWVRRKGNSRCYNPWTNPTMITEFNTACFRLHSLIYERITKYPIDGRKQCLRDMYCRASLIYNGYMDEVLEGLCQKPAQKYDRFVTTDMTDKLLRRPGKQGRDIAAINIQRGRDHGLPPYVDFVYFISGGKYNITGFEDLIHFIDWENIHQLKELYCDVRDIDLWVGLNSERVPRHMAVGETAAIAIAIQFHRLKCGDRFYFEHPGHFTKDQLESLKEITLAKVLCDNSNIEQMQENAFILPNSRNPFRHCSEIRRVDLNLWKEEKDE